MTTPTPRTDALTKRMAGELDRPMLQQNHFIELCDHSRQLERDLAAAQAQSIRDSMTIEHSRVDAYNLRLELAAAQEARERAEERVRELENFADLMADEFQRIVVCCKSGDTFVASEIIGLCQRAVKTTKQNVPVIVQRDRAEALAESYKAANAILAHALKHFADESKWGPVADYSAGYWYMTGKPWIPAAKAVEQSDAAIAGEPK